MISLFLLFQNFLARSSGFDFNCFFLLNENCDEAQQDFQFEIMSKAICSYPLPCIAKIDKKFYAVYFMSIR